MTNHSKAVGGKEINVFGKTYLFERWKRGQRLFTFFTYMRSCGIVLMCYNELAKPSKY